MLRRISAALAAAFVFACAALPAAAGPIRQVDAYWPASSPASGCWTVQVQNAHTYAPGTAPETLRVLSPGFDANGKPTQYTRDLVLTVRVRQAYPSQANQSGARVALSNYVYRGDFIPGVKNRCNSNAPKSVAQWGTPSRMVVGNTLSGVEVLAFSRDAQQGSEVAAVDCSATDGTTTVHGIVSTMTVSTRPDVNPVIVYLCPSLNITSLNAGQITVNADVYPYYGGNASILHSADQGSTFANQRLFSPRYFWKDTGSPVVAFVCPLNDGSCTATATTSCTASKTVATAEGAPCSTYQAAMNALKTFGAIDNAIIYIADNSGTPPALAGPTSGAMTQNGGCLTVTRDPLITRANAQLTFGNSAGPVITTVTNPAGTGCIRFFDMTMKRTTGNTIPGNATNPLEIVWDQVNIDDGSFTGTWLNSSTRADDYIFDATITNPGANFLGAPTLGDHRIIRGVSITTPGTVEANAIVGSTLVGAAGLPVPNGLTSDGTILAFNKFFKITTSSLGIVSTAVPNGAAYVQNVWEETSATASNTLYTVSNDAQTNSTNNMILQYDTVLGAFGDGRSNLFYNEGPTPRSNVMQDCRGLLLGQANTKHDVFHGLNEAGADAPTRTDGWGYLHAVGCQGNFTQYIDANSGGIGSAFAQAYGGPGSKIGTSGVTAQMPVTKFTDYEAVTCVTPGTSCASYVAGAGSGTYSLTTGAAVKGIVPVGALPFDLAGVARPATADTAGAYVAP